MVPYKFIITIIPYLTSSLNPRAVSIYTVHVDIILVVIFLVTCNIINSVDDLQQRVKFR